MSELAQRPPRDLSSVTPFDLGHDGSVLMADLSEVNRKIARYILANLDADAGRREPWSRAAQLELADALAEAGRKVREHAERGDERG